jgi:hypothetical protein
VPPILLDIFIFIVHIFGALISALPTYNHPNFLDNIVQLIVIAVYLLLPF